VIVRGAFADSLKARGAGGIKMLFQHDPNQPIGVWEVIREDRAGLYVRGRITTGVERGREVLALMRAGALDGLSIGFQVVRGRRDARTGVLRLSKVDLWEISIVTFPMLAEARVSAVKARPFAGRTPAEREFERWLTRDAGLTRKEARAVMSAGLKGLQSLRDADGGGTGEARLMRRITDAAALLRCN